VPAAALAADISGIVVDPDGRPLPRAHVVVVYRPDAGTLAERPASFTREIGYTDQTGRFTADSGDRPPDQAGRACRVEASLAGFRTASVPCSTGSALRIELALAPVEEAIVVTATRSNTPSTQTGLAVTTFSADDLARRQTPPVSELLRTSPGAMVLQTGTPGGVTGLFIRGGESNYNTVLVDGIPLNEPGGTFNFNNLTTENVERVEVLRGANSALFGSDAMSSVVQLFTKRGTRSAAGRPFVTGQLDGGSYGTVHASAGVSGGSGPFDYSVAAARLSTDNRVPNNGFDTGTVSGNTGLVLGSRAQLRGVFRAERGTNGTPGQTAYGRPDLDAFYEHHDVVGGVSFEYEAAPAFHQRVAYSLSSSNQRSVNLLEDPPYTPAFEGRRAPFEFSDFTFDSDNRFRRHYASYQADLQLTRSPAAGDHRLTLLADWNGERADLDNRLTGERAQQSRDNAGVAVQHQMLWRRLSTTAGVRFEHNDSFGGAVVPRLSAVYTMHESGGAIGDTRIRGAAGLGIKEPTILQSFSTSPYFLGNPELDPERSRSVEAGIEQRLASDRAKIEVTWFDNRYRDIIGLRPTGGFTSTYFNIGLTRARGAEIASEAAPIAPLRLRAGYTFVDSKILASTSDSSEVLAAGNWAFRRPRHSGYVEATVTAGRLVTTLGGTFVGRYVDSDFSSLLPSILANPGRTLWNARASWRFTSAVSGLLAIDNLANRDYQEPLGYLALQRSVRAGIRVGL
jgi:outer membrane cobalamin receptor